jgi:hypothetical protein
MTPFNMRRRCFINCAALYFPSCGRSLSATACSDSWRNAMAASFPASRRCLFISSDIVRTVSSISCFRRSISCLSALLCAAAASTRWTVSNLAPPGSSARKSAPVLASIHGIKIANNSIGLKIRAVGALLPDGGYSATRMAKNAIRRDVMIPTTAKQAGKWESIADTLAVAIFAAALVALVWILS